MQGSSTRTFLFPVSGGREAPAEAITEPSGSGPFAEAMRELIAQLSPVPEPLRAAQAKPVTDGRRSTQAPPRSTRADQRHLRLVR